FCSFGSSDPKSFAFDSPRYKLPKSLNFSKNSPSNKTLPSPRNELGGVRNWKHASAGVEGHGKLEKISVGLGGGARCDSGVERVWQGQRAQIRRRDRRLRDFAAKYSARYPDQRPSSRSEKRTNPSPRHRRKFLQEQKGL